MSIASKKIGFLGAGAMAESIIAGMVNSNLTPPENIWASDVDENRVKYLKDTYRIQVAGNNAELVKTTDVVILSVKPFVLKDVLEQVSALITKDQLIVSIAAGLSTGYVSGFFTDQVPVVRVMPNTPALVGEGASALAAGTHADRDDMAIVEQVFASIGRTVVVREQDMDAVTGLSGSGPAYMYLIIEALSDAGVRAGLPRQVALELAAQTMYGAAKMVLETGEHPAALKDKVTTPGGTTITGLHVLEKGQVRGTLIDAVLAAIRKSQEMGAAK